VDANIHKTEKDELLTQSLLKILFLSNRCIYLCTGRIVCHSWFFNRQLPDFRNYLIKGWQYGNVYRFGWLISKLARFLLKIEPEQSSYIS